ncbi:MAG: glycosyl transferase, partial [Acetobacteraceae bacterium]
MINLPAEKVLTEPKFRAIQWARFDAAWYRARYSDAADAIGSNDDAATLRWYLDHGQRQGHDPNRYFCESWFLGRHHDIAEVVSEGRFPSGFDAYCRGNNRTRAPHWLFDERFYRARYPDLTDDLLTDAEMPNGYEHFLRHGCREGRIGHPLFDPAVYLDALPPEERAAATQAGPFHHYLDRLEAGRAAERTSVYFDPAWYLRHHPKAREAISRGQFRSA